MAIPNAFNGEMKKNIIKSGLFSFARLFKTDRREFRDLIMNHCKDAKKKLPTIPGEVSHRLKIITLLAKIVSDFYDEIIAAFEEFNEAYGQGKWQPTSER